MHNTRKYRFIHRFIHIVIIPNSTTRSGVDRTAQGLSRVPGGNTTVRPAAGRRYMCRDLVTVPHSVFNACAG
ncbi:hypothetical protein J6590_077540, partial [Homalodisca vitripennis]